MIYFKLFLKIFNCSLLSYKVINILCFIYNSVFLYIDLYSYNEGKVPLKKRERATQALKKQQCSKPYYQYYYKYPIKSVIITAKIANRS